MINCIADNRNIWNRREKYSMIKKSFRCTIEHCMLRQCEGEKVLDEAILGRLPLGTVVNEKYEIQKVIGSGGFGTTYLAQDLVLKMPVAVKEYKKQSYVSEKEKQRFLEEARTMARLAGNPGIVNVRDYFEANQTVYIVMEYLDGITLEKYIEKYGRLPVFLALDYMKPVMRVLEKIHKKGLIHRDISPDNIMVLEGNEIKLLDFGAARDVENAEGTLSIIYKPGYAPEEQCRGGHDQGPWTDVYAMCATIYKCITGVTPQYSLQRLHEDRISRPSDLGAEIAPALEEVLMKGMAVRREDRIQSMEELLDKIQTALGEQERTAGEKGAEKFSENLATVGGEGWENEKEKSAEAEAIEAKNEESSEADTKIYELKRKRERIFGNKRFFLMGTAGLILFIILISIITAWRANPYKYTDMSSLIRDMTVTPEILKQVGKDKKRTSLYLESCRLDDQAIQGMAAMENLEQIRIRDCIGFTSLKPLEKLENLKYLEIIGDRENFQSLNGQIFADGSYPQIEKLRINYADLSEVGASLAGFTGLDTLVLSDTKGIRTLEFLKGMGNLRTLELDNTFIQGCDWSFIGYCTNLTRFSGENSGIDDLSALEACGKLKELNVSRTEETGQAGITDITPLTFCQDLSSVRLRGNQVSDMSPLNGCRELRLLDLGENQIQDVSVLSEMTRLVNLELDRNRITDISPIRSCSKLEYLNLEKNRIADISALDNSFTELMTLRISDNQITALEPLAECQKLSEIRADNNQLSSLAGLEKKWNLKILSVRGNQIEDITAVKDSKELSYMDLGGNRIQDITVLSALGTDVEGLLLDQNRITDISGLPAGIEYKVLALQGNPIADYTPLTSLQKVNSSQDRVIISYTEDLDYSAIMESSYTKGLWFVGVPVEQQANYSKAFEEKHKEASYMQLPFWSEEEMKEKMEEIRELNKKN